MDFVNIVTTNVTQLAMEQVLVTVQDAKMYKTVHFAWKPVLNANIMLVGIVTSAMRIVWEDVRVQLIPSGFLGVTLVIKLLFMRRMEL